MSELLDQRKKILLLFVVIYRIHIYYDTNSIHYVHLSKKPELTYIGRGMFMNMN